jgi:O-succinylbenzoic acid--CoA ligase
MATPVTLPPEFWHDGSVWIAQPDPSAANSTLAEFARHELQARDWCFFQTSGTEGTRKWVGLTKEALLTSARAVNAHFSITSRDHWLLALPTHHVGGFGILARAFVSGSRVTPLAGKWDATTFVQQCTALGATLASLVPTQIFDLVAAQLHAPASLRIVLVGGGALNQALADAAAKLGWPLHCTYAMTETASSVAAQTTPGGALEVLPIWNVSTNADGVLSIRGAALAKGYATCASGAWRWEAIPAATGLRTRDRVELILNEAGRHSIRFLGRESGIVKILGELVALEPIQDHLEALRLKLGLCTADAAVCAVADARKENSLVLAVCRMSTADAAGLQKDLNAMLRPFEHIHEVRMLDAIPRSELGKVRLAELRSLL